MVSLLPGCLAPMWRRLANLHVLRLAGMPARHAACIPAVPTVRALLQQAVVLAQLHQCTCAALVALSVLCGPLCLHGIAPHTACIWQGSCLGARVPAGTSWRTVCLEKGTC